MKCPYIRDVPQSTCFESYDLEHHDGEVETICNATTPVFQTQVDIMADCIKEDCAAWQSGLNTERKEKNNGFNCFCC